MIIKVLFWKNYFELIELMEIILMGGYALPRNFLKLKFLK